MKSGYIKQGYIKQLVLIMLVAASIGLMSGTAWCASFPITVRDDLGNTISFNKPAQRVISLAPSNTEILFALGLDAKVIGVDSYSNYPAAALKKTKVGSPQTPAVEMIVSLRPDLVIIGDLSDKSLTDRLGRLGIPVLGLAPDNLVGVYNAIETIGKVCGADQPADALIAKMKNQTTAVVATVKKASTKPSVLVEIWPDPLYSAGPGSFMDELVTLAGGKNIAADAKSAWPVLSLETVVARNPDVIITTQPLNNSIATKAKSALAGTKAVQAGRIVMVDQDAISRPGPRLTEALLDVARALHPELF